MLNTLNLNTLDDELDHLPTEISLEGRPNWLFPDGTTLPIIRGGADGDGDDDGDAGDGDDDGDAGDGDGDDDGAGGDDGQDDEDRGFPANTPVAEMTDKQQAAYWKDKARKHENRGKQRGDESAEVKRLRKENDKLKREKMSDAEKAVDDARREGEQTGLKTASEKLVKAELRAAGATKGVDLEKLTTAAELLDHSKFLDDDGDVDTDKVNAFIEGIATPGTGSNDQGKKGSTDLGQGRRQGGAGKASVASGRDLFNERHGKKAD